MTIAHIVATAANGVIGNRGQIPWHLPADLRFFRQTTTGHVVLMGRRTYESIGFPLKARVNFIISRRKNFTVAGAFVFPSIEDALTAYTATYAAAGQSSLFIIGGATVYWATRHHVDTVYMTRLSREFVGDTYYPPLDRTRLCEVARDEHSAPFPFSFITYRRLPAQSSDSKTKLTVTAFS